MSSVSFNIDESNQSIFNELHESDQFVPLEIRGRKLNIDDENDEFILTMSGKEYLWRTGQPSIFRGINITESNLVPRHLSLPQTSMDSLLFSPISGNNTENSTSSINIISPIARAKNISLGLSSSDIKHMKEIQPTSIKHLHQLNYPASDNANHHSNDQISPNKTKPFNASMCLEEAIRFNESINFTEIINPNESPCFPGNLDSRKYNIPDKVDNNSLLVTYDKNTIKDQDSVGKAGSIQLGNYLTIVENVNEHLASMDFSFIFQDLGNSFIFNPVIDEDQNCPLLQENDENIHTEVKEISCYQLRKPSDSSSDYINPPSAIFQMQILTSENGGVNDDPFFPSNVELSQVSLSNDNSTQDTCELGQLDLFLTEIKNEGFILDDPEQGAGAKEKKPVSRVQPKNDFLPVLNYADSKCPPIEENEGTISFINRKRRLSKTTCSAVSRANGSFCPLDSSSPCNQIMKASATYKNKFIANLFDEPIKNCLFFPGLVWAPNKTHPSFLSPFRMAGKGNKWITPISSSSSFKIHFTFDNKMEVVIDSPPVLKKYQRASFGHLTDTPPLFTLTPGSSHYIRKENQSQFQLANLIEMKLNVDSIFRGKLGDISFMFLFGTEVIPISSLKNIAILSSRETTKTKINDMLSETHDINSSMPIDLNDTPANNLFQNEPISLSEFNTFSKNFSSRIPSENNKPLENPTLGNDTFLFNVKSNREAHSDQQIIYCFTGNSRLPRKSKRPENQVASLAMLVELFEKPHIQILVFFTSSRNHVNGSSLDWISRNATRTAKLLAAAVASITQTHKNIVFKLLSSEEDIKNSSFQWKVDSQSVPFPRFGKWVILGDSREWMYILKAGNAKIVTLTLADCVLVVGRKEAPSLELISGKTIFTCEKLSQLIMDQLVSMLVPV